MDHREHVIKAVEEAIPFVGSRGYGDVAELLHDVLELLKLQEPKPVIVKLNAYDYRNYYCPKCGAWFEDAYRKPNYCDRCGQAVKWDG